MMGNSQGHRPHRLGHSRAVRAMVAGGVVFLLGWAALGVTPVAAAVRPLSVAPPSSRGGSGPRTHTCVCAASSVDLAQLKKSGARTFRGVSPAAAATEAGPTQAIGQSDNGAYSALAPTRLLDTRTDGKTLGPNESLNLQVIGGSVPSNASAVALNVTVTGTTSSGYLSVYPTGEARPLLSNLNWVAGETVPNLVIVPVGENGEVTFYNYAGDTNVVVDLQGFFAPEPSDSTAGSYVALTPARIADTRPNSGEPYSGDTLGPNQSLDIQVAGEGGIPASGVTAALLNVTVTNTTAASFLTVYPQGNSRPLASDLNWVGGDTVANRVVVPVNPTTGQITVYNDTGSTDVIIDADGYFTNGSTTPSNAGLFSTISPIRVLDTRATHQTLGPGGQLTQELAGVDGISSQATAVVTNVTATNTTAASYFTVYPGGTKPLASDVNWSAGQTVPNLTVATLSSGGATTVFNHAGDADLIIDAFGFFGPRVPLSVTTTALADATKGTAYSATLQAAGGSTPYSWAVIAGALPAGLSLSSDGVIQGTPTVTGSFTFSVQVTDSTTPTPETASAQLTLTVNVAPLSITTTSLPKGVVGATYSATLTATGGTPPYQWTLTSGSMPSGLSLSSSGVISGTPSTSGTFSVGIEATDSTTPTAEVATTSLSLTIAPELAVATTSLPTGTVGVSYSATLQASGGTAPYSWTLTSGSLPPGLSLSSGGDISGEPTTSATYTFVVQVSDSTAPTHESASATLSVTIYLGPAAVSGSSNWSGYWLGNGPYTYVQGTFDVPYIEASSTNTDTAEWVGIDGATNSDLIQAGIDEPYTASTNTYYVVAWWEILPAYETPISMSVSPGDSITVVIEQVSGSLWDISITDNTTGATFTTEQTYTGPMDSVEWIVEAPTDSGVQSVLGPYTPDVSFTNLSLTGAQNSLTEVIMVQNGNQVSTPSSLNANGFSIAYGAVAPAPP